MPLNATVPWRVWDALLLVMLGVFCLLVSLVAAQGLYRLQGGVAAIPAQSTAAFGLAATALFYGVLLIGAWLLVVRRYRTGWAAVGLRIPQGEAIVAALLFFGAIIVGLGGLVLLLLWVREALGLSMQIAPGASGIALTSPLFVVALSISVVLTPITEEIVFRGILYQSLRKQGGAAVAVIGSALFFTVLHLSLGAAPEFLFLGIMFACLFERTRSLYPSIVIHALYNAILIVLAVRLS